MQRDLFMERREWLLQRHRALSPRQLALAYGVLCALSFSVAAGFLLMGVWQVLFFTALEMSAVTCAFIYTARHAADHEHIVLSRGCLLVESRRAGVLRQTRLDPCRTRVAAPRTPRAPIVLSAHPLRLEVGALASAPQRVRIAQELQAELLGGLYAP